MSQGGQGSAELPVGIERVKVRLGWEPLKVKKCEKQSGTDELWPKNEYHQISSSFGQHALNMPHYYANKHFPVSFCILIDANRMA